MSAPSRRSAAIPAALSAVVLRNDGAGAEFACLFECGCQRLLADTVTARGSSEPDSDLQHARRLPLQADDSLGALVDANDVAHLAHGGVEPTPAPLMKRHELGNHGLVPRCGVGGHRVARMRIGQRATSQLGKPGPIENGERDGH
jgi:hypothetical protein